MKINGNYQNLEESYLFSTIGKKVATYSEKNPSADIIRLGIGDVTLPLAPVVVEALKSAADEMGHKETFRGYIPNEQGYIFLREAIAGYYSKQNVSLNVDEIFITDGAKSDTANILDIFSDNTLALIPNPVYPVYRDTNTMTGRNIIYIDANAENNFLPLPDMATKVDVIYLCSPNNPTGAVYTRDMLTKWVEYANHHNAVIFFDAAYEAFVSDPDLPKSIYEISGAKTCAIEFCSLSKTAGFTGTRCGYTIVPLELKAVDIGLNAMWARRQSTKFNGVSYIIQRGAEAVFSEKGQEQCRENIEYYRNNAKTISSTLDKLGIWYVGGTNSPYIWLKCPNNMKSWDFFDLLLEQANVVGTPGVGFGSNGEGYFRLTAFGSNGKTVEAMQRFETLKY